MDAYERANTLLGAVIAAYSGRIGDATSPSDIERLHQLRQPYLDERRRLTASDTTRVREINESLPSLLREVREGKQ